MCPKFLDRGPVTVLPDCLRSNQASLRHAETALTRKPSPYLLTRVLHECEANEEVFKEIYPCTAREGAG